MKKGMKISGVIALCLLVISAMAGPSVLAHVTHVPIQPAEAEYEYKFNLTWKRAAHGDHEYKGRISPEGTLSGSSSYVDGGYIGQISGYIIDGEIFIKIRGSYEWHGNMTGDVKEAKVKVHGAYNFEGTLKGSYLELSSTEPTNISPLFGTKSYDRITGTLQLPPVSYPKRTFS